MVKMKSPQGGKCAIYYKQSKCQPFVPTILVLEHSHQSHQIVYSVKIIINTHKSLPHQHPQTSNSVSIFYNSTPNRLSNYSSANLNLPFKYSFSLSPSFCHQSFPLSLSLAPFLGNAHQRKPIYTVKGPLIAAVVISSQGWWSRRSGDGFVAGVVDFMVLLYLSSPIWVL